ncbi:MAG TPA: tellurite resistance/C4-dicarboxylate transporter family protein [Solirubrobacterales bacterium]|nr:tellurite resistance/C4-dicarboxylate transporter family protein [Solirubrobacterales bacterium]
MSVWKSDALPWLENLSPSYFAMAMATGIVSIGCQLLGLRPVAIALFAVNIATYVVLWVLDLWRVVRFPRHVLADLVSHRRGLGFLTIVAATGVLGAEMVILWHAFTIATILLGFAGVLWVGLTYAIFAALTIDREKPSLAEGISGTWLLAVVATQSIAVLTALLAAHWGQSLQANFIALSMWLWGGMLYIWLISLIFYRYTFFTLEPDDLTPPYWINMGAMAISTLAGSLLVENGLHSSFLHPLRPFLEGFTVLYWATGTWWIPIIVILGVWRFGYRRLPFEYDPQYWSAVFPLGMYTVATYRMIEALDLHFLDLVPKVFLGLALFAWLATFLGLLWTLGRGLGNVGHPSD